MRDSHGRLVFITGPSSSGSSSRSESEESLCKIVKTRTKAKQVTREKQRQRRAKFKSFQFHENKREKLNIQNRSTKVISFRNTNQNNLAPSSSNDTHLIYSGQVVAQNENKQLDYDANTTRDHLCIPRRKRGSRTRSSITAKLIILATSYFLSISCVKSAANHSCDKYQSKCDYNQNHHLPLQQQQLQHLLRHHLGNNHNGQTRYNKEPIRQRYDQQEYYKRHKRHHAINDLEPSSTSSVVAAAGALGSISMLNQSINNMLMMTITTAANKTQQTGPSSLNTLDSIRIAAFASKLEQMYTCHRLATNEMLATLSASRATPLEQGTLPAATRCQAHFDGHLCWPAAKPGQLIKLACPRLNWLSNVEQALIMQQRDQLQPRVQEKQSVKSVINLIQLPTTTSTTTTTVQPIAREEPNNNNKNDNNPSLTSLDVANTRAFIDDDRPMSQSVSVTDKIEASAGTTEARFAHRRCHVGKPVGFGDGNNEPTPRSTQPPQSGPYLMLESVNGGTFEAPSWQTEADYSECSISSSVSEAFNRQQQQQHGSKESQDQKLLGEFDPTDKWVKLNEEPDRRLSLSLMEELERIEGAIDPYSDPDLLEQWTLCIGNIMRYQQAHHHNQQSAVATTNTSGLWCPIIFDGWRCWPSTRAGDTAYVSCPSNQPGFSAERKAHKICTANGTWYRHPMTNRYWSNYTTCVDTVDLAFRRKILNLYIFGNLISLVALSASLIIFISFKNLNCTRVTIHKNLFLSFITNNLMWIIWYTYVVNDANLLQSNPIECQLWHILLHYFLISNYFWMFCEGLYLHTLLVVAFVSEDKILKWFYLLGWILPIPITVAYAYNRSYDEYYTNFCWMEESPYNLILMGPIVISLLLNLVFLINIVRVLVTKLRANNSPDTHQTRKAVRATLILIPLLGLHYILTPFRPEAKSEWEGIYEIFAAVCTSFQGLCVALLFCFCNGEVITVIKKKLKDTFNSNQHHSGNGDLNYHRRNTLLKLNNDEKSNVTNTNTNINFNTNNHHIKSATISNNDSHTLRSVISSSSNGDIIVQQQQQIIQLKQPILNATTNSTTKTNIKTLCSFVDQRSNRTNSNISNSSSVLTTVTASPIQMAQTISAQAINDINRQTKTRVHDKEGESLSATVDGEFVEQDLNGSIARKLTLSKRKNSLSGSCLDKAETVHLLQSENNHGVLTTTTSFSVLT